MRFRFAALAFVVLTLPLGSYRLSAQSAPLPPGSSDAATDAANRPQATEPLADAEALIGAKNFDKARMQLDFYLATHPDDPRSLFDRGYCDDAEGKTASAKEFYGKAIAADPKQFESRLALGLILAKEGDPGAREQLQAAAELDPSPPNPAAKGQALRALAQYVWNIDPDTAKQALLDALKITPETPQDTLLAAEIAEAEGNNDLAEQAYRRVLSVDPQSSEAISGLAHLLLEEKRYSDAEPLIKSALTRDPDDPTLNTQYAALLAAEGKTAEAVESLEKLHRLQPGDRGIARMLADSYFQAGDMQKADSAYAELLTKTPNDAELESMRGQVLIREGNYAEALILLQNASKTRQDDPDVWGGIAFCASKTGQFSEVLTALAMRSKIVADTSATYFLWATANDNLHRKKEALEYYQLFLKSASGKFPNEEWQAKQRIAILMK